MGGWPSGSFFMVFSSRVVGGGLGVVAKGVPGLGGISGWGGKWIVWSGLGDMVLFVALRKTICWFIGVCGFNSEVHV
jgi:hypothetical protein